MIIYASIFLSGCANADSKEAKEEIPKQTMAPQEDIYEKQADLSIEAQTAPVLTEQQETLFENNNTPNPANIMESAVEKTDIAKEIKNYIMNEQGNKSEAEKVKWSEAFLNQVNIDAVYKEYLLTGGIADDAESFAVYLTQHAPVPDNWKDLFEADFYNLNDPKIKRYEYLENELYQVYVEIDGSDVPYVVVSAKTGYFHG